MKKMKHENEMGYVGTAFWSDERKCWLVMITDNDRAEFFEVEACDEFVIPMAMMEFCGINSTAVFDENGAVGWRCERCDDSCYSIEELAAMVG